VAGPPGVVAPPTGFFTVRPGVVEVVGLGVPEALVLGVALVDGLVAGAESLGAPEGQTVGNGSVGEALGLAASAGAATKAPATMMARALGTAIAVARRRE
jgi:hypothetical protein